MKAFENREQLAAADHLFGLIGYPLSHSFSKKYFAEKFSREGREGCYYELFPLPAIGELPELLRAFPNLRGLNVTIPYKQAVIPYLDRLDPDARAVGAVNTIRIREGRCEGFNTDVIGFEQSLRGWLAGLGRQPERALVLGTGGAAQAVRYVLGRMSIEARLVSRRPGPSRRTYGEIDEAVLARHLLIINTTPLGMAPQTDQKPDLPYGQLTPAHLLYDLVYNPEKTLFLDAGSRQGAATKNGLEMLHLQAEAAWAVWNRSGLPEKG